MFINHNMPIHAGTPKKKKSLRKNKGIKCRKYPLDGVKEDKSVILYNNCVKNAEEFKCSEI